MKRMWAIDVEGSGKSPAEIVEIAIVELDGLELTGQRRHWRLKPRNGIAPVVSRLHGIWDRDVEDAPDLEDVAGDVLEWLGDDPVVAHNAKVDFDILTRSLKEWSPSAVIDTLRLARRLLPDEERHGLERLGDRLGIAARAAETTGGSAHSAPYDALLVALLLVELLRPLTDEERAASLGDADILKSRQESFL